MPRPRPPYLHKTTSRHGKTVWYVHRDRTCKRVRLKAEYGTPAFWQEYHEAMAVEPERSDEARGSFKWIVAEYRKSTAWTNLSMATRRQRENILKPILERVGSEPIRYFDRKNIQAGVDRRREKPAQARHFFDTMAGVLRWAFAEVHIKVDPTKDILLPRAPKTEGFPVWTAADMAAFEAKWSVGTRERLAYDVLLYTGLRRGDAARLGPEHVVNGRIEIENEKTGILVAIPILPELQASMDASPTGATTFITGEKGGAFTKEAFGNWFREVCNEAGVKKSAHGLRKAGATRAAENGATESMLEAIFGWVGGRQASHYTRSANRKKLAETSAHLLRREA